MGIASTIMLSFPANSNFNAMEFSPASLQIWDPNSTKYAIPIIFKSIEKYAISTLDLWDKTLIMSMIYSRCFINIENIIRPVVMDMYMAYSDLKFLIILINIVATIPKPTILNISNYYHLSTA